MKDVTDVPGLETSKDFIAPIRILDALGKVVRVIASRRPRRSKLMGLVVGTATLVLAMIASPAMAYMAVITTSVAVTNSADEAELQTAVELAVTDVLKHAIAFSPTTVALEKATVIGNRLYLVLFLSDEDVESGVSTLPGLVAPQGDPIDSPEKAPRTSM